MGAWPASNTTRNSGNRGFRMQDELVSLELSSDPRLWGRVRLFMKAYIWRPIKHVQRAAGKTLLAG
jgi:hypothetical protein